MTTDTARRVACRFTTTATDNAGHPSDPPHDEPFLTEEQLRAELEPRFGHIELVQIHPPGDQDHTTAEWEAITADGLLVRGTVTLRTQWLNDGLLVLPSIEVVGAVPRSPKNAASTTPRQLLDHRLREVALRLRRLITQARARPDVPAHSIAKELTEIADLAERTAK